MTGGESAGQGDVLREELARLLDAGGAPDATDALDVLWIARLSGLDPVDWSLLGSGADPTAPAPSADLASPPPEEKPSAPLPDPEPPLAGIHLPGADGAAPGRPGGAHVIRVAQPSALPDALALTRALRPLRQQVPSARARTLDVAATAAASGDTGLLLPILRPATERRFSVDLLIDTGTTMTVWHRLADELRTLLARHGAFADVRAWALNTDGPEPTLAPFRRGAQAVSPTRHWKQSLADPAGRRAVLVLTDGVGPAWHGTELPAALADWSVRRPVAALQVLPSRLWHRTALRALPVRARGAETHRAAIEVRSTGPLPGIARGRAGAADRAQIRWLPTLEVSGDWLGPWARLVSGRTVERVPLQAVPLTVAQRPGPADPMDEPNTPAGWISRFEEGYSPEAFGLLRLLAAAPLSLPVMRLVQRTMVPSSTPMHLAEIFVSGLLVRRTPAEPGEDPDGVLYDFRDGVRDTLLERLTRTESLLVLEQVIDGVSERVAATFGGVTDFGALVIAVKENGGLDGLELPEGSRAFAEVALAVIGGVGGDYREVAAKLARRRTEAAPRTESAPAEAVPDERENRRRGRRLLPWLRSKKSLTMTVGNVQVSVGVGSDLKGGRAGGPLPSRVPERPPFYVRRGEAAEVMQVLLRGHPAEHRRYPIRAMATCVIEGAAGVGKTALAADCAEALAPDFTLVRWIRAGSRKTLLGDLTALADDLGIPRTKEEHRSFPARRLAGLRDHLTRHPGWLLIYDGVSSATFASAPDDPEESGKLCLPPEGYGSLLMTRTERTRWPAAYRTELRDPDGASAVEYLREMLAGHRGKAWKWSEELADLVDVVGTRLSVLAHFASKLQEGSQTAGSLAVETLVGREEVREFMGSLVWITRAGEFLATGVAVRSDAVLTAGFEVTSGPFHIHRLDGRAFRVRDVMTRDSRSGLIMMRLENSVLSAAPLSPFGSREVGAAWYASRRSSKEPVCTVSLAARSAAGRSLKSAALFDNDGRLHSIVVSDRETVSKHVVTSGLIDAFIAVITPGAVVQVRDREPETTPFMELQQRPLFYLSYARTPDARTGSRSREHRFFVDLTRQLAELTHTPQEGLGFIDVTLPPGMEWQQAMKEALATARVFVPLYSPRYFKSAWCGMEWDAFGRRQQRDNGLRGRQSSAIVPVLWASTEPRHLPSVSWGIQYADHELGDVYADRGMLGLMEFGSRGEYERGVRHIAETIVHTAQATHLAPCDPHLFDDLRNAFEDEEPQV
ncbi:TIR-like protein FxsC [Streptomyces sp. NPDC001928]|uniref:TIR-like protein FxsC n=1 Tax=Streptomyces sp. NPDC001928 TaxID=3154404 RepID=UPI003333EF57